MPAALQARGALMSRVRGRSSGAAPGSGYGCHIFHVWSFHRGIDVPDFVPVIYGNQHCGAGSGCDGFLRGCSSMCGDGCDIFCLEASFYAGVERVMLLEVTKVSELGLGFTVGLLGWCLFWLGLELDDYRRSKVGRPGRPN